MVNRKAAFANAVAAGALVVSFGASASAADLSRPPPPFVVPFSPWSGFYVGGNVGGVSASESVDGFASTDPSGFAGGFQAGYNWRIAPRWLVGLEEEITLTDASGSVPGFQSNHNWYDTFDARAGYLLPWRHWLAYGKVGAAWMNADYAGDVSVNTTRSGWNVGVGAEYMIAPRWSVKAEYDYLDFGTDTIPVYGGTAVDTQVNEFKVGVNYHFLPAFPFGRW